VSSFPLFNPTPTFNYYSGYLPLNQTTGKSIFYIFVESQSDPSSDPLLMWMNGGPCCSSLEGLFSENGPYVLKDWTKEFVVNEYSWNKKANLLYFEFPVGVGYSKPGTTEDMTTNDEITASDNLSALLKFFEYFSEYKTNEFYIAGESYAGVYVPTLAHKIQSHNTQGLNPINLKGFMIGNPYMDYRYDCDNTYPDFAYNYGLIPPDLYEEWEQSQCDAIRNTTGYCGELTQRLMASTSELNIYDIYHPCKPPESSSKYLFQSYSSVTCDDYLTGFYEYMNRDDVRKAFHVTSDIVWEDCSDAVNYDQDYTVGSIYLFHTGEDGLLGKGYKIMIYSGDTDSVCPTIGTRATVEALKLKVNENWKQWRLKLDWQISGFRVRYEGLDFVTIKGTGHMSIEWKRAQGERMFRAFIEGQDLCES
jgi:carboxypeptidase C (cathepsin A)